MLGQFLEEVVGIAQIVEEHPGHDNNECYNHMLGRMFAQSMLDRMERTV